ncbi:MULTISPECIES: hypothetical protein [Clostridium]|uniref:hypothetical protein n=2 Tax=Clostridiaceae TaxID=31979 RepID=UPI0006ABEC5A|nr:MULTISPECIES: hypothetical protein [Clostridium]KOR24425.1 hypothetical protein ND00_26960 [Clostridium sp. L74]
MSILNKFTEKELEVINKIKNFYKYNLIDIDLLELKNILLDYSNIYVRILNVLYSIKGKHGQSIFKEIGFILEYMKNIKLT